MVDGVLATLIKSFVLVNILMVFFAFMTWVERKLIGRFQARYGPNRVGPYGLLQPIADLGKMLQKENMIPTGAKPKLYLMAPWIAMACALGAFGLMPFGNVATIPGTDYTFHLYIADTSVSLLVVAAIGSLGFYGLMIGGWASSSKYALLGGMRAIAQLVSYEVAFTLAVIGVIIQAGSLSFVTISNAQDNLWYVIPQILGFLVFFVAAVAESNRPPFDLTEAEGEVVAGYHTEYGGMRYAMFAAAEFVNAITLSALGAVLFFGGPSGPYLPGPIWMLIKIGGFLFVLIWIRATLPRVRFDQLMKLGWKVLLPVATLNLLLTAAIVVYR
ncbi:MAG: NADH-quinone oxidoreductase subunit NuoH [Gaiellales bacterium]|jgi:NADH-quinone oxidoreductase subunit H|nr:NADH-quinone oxidoreductase subunit NuoH [Gaiellales bacterium]